MRVPEDFLGSVAFLADRVDGRYRFAGTAFVVGVPSEKLPTRDYLYLATARHCVDRPEGTAGLQLRVNTINGGAAWFDLGGAEWLFHPDPGVDLAVFPFQWPEEATARFGARDGWHIPLAAVLGPSVAEEANLGPGDAVYSVGLFAGRAGAARNLPIVRAGTIAAMPGEALVDELTGHEYEAYLVEMRSTGGLSGSPMFVFIEGTRLAWGRDYPFGSYRAYLLGLLRGHFFNWSSGMESTHPGQINSGIAFGVPAHYLMEILNDADLVKMRRRADGEQSTDG